MDAQPGATPVWLSEHYLLLIFFFLLVFITKFVELYLNILYNKDILIHNNYILTMNIYYVPGIVSIILSVKNHLILT